MQERRALVAFGSAPDGVIVRLVAGDVHPFFVGLHLSRSPDGWLLPSFRA
ncbi:hypothetical protein [Puniceibacterium sediminis]|uniref:Uncharacterized protein n=1 Tax=Puniceibacterium sediminis TaxID=1608407 RepID=A0A238XET4_9RHOB|nr:hypothetical protein [Puniceibacterium sediminis]SNR57071.1 hypothetical protein SAMN06265370_110157 [Puniceibacterium sediminis]